MSEPAPSPPGGAPAASAPSVVTRGRVLRALTASYVQTAVTMLISLATTPLYLRLLGGEMYGLWLTAMSFVTYFSLSGAGFPQAATNRLAAAHAEGQPARAGVILTTAAWTTLLLAALGAALGAGLVGSGLVSPGLFRGSPAMQRVAIPAILILVGTHLGVMPLEQFRGALRAFQRVDVEQALTTVSRVTQLALGALVLLRGGGVIALAAAQTSVTWVVGLASMLLVARLFPAVPLRPARWDAGLARELASPSLHFLLLSIGGALIWNTDNLVLSSHLGTLAVTPYAVSVGLMSTVTNLLLVGTGSLLPSLTALWATGEKARLRTLLYEVLRVVTAASGLLILELGFHGREFIGLWAGPDAVAPRSVFLALLAIFFIRTVAACFGLLFVATSTHHRYAYAALAEGAVNLALSLVLVRHIGMLGVALGTLIAHVLGTGSYLPWTGSRMAGLRVGTLLREVALPSAVPALGAGAVGVVMSGVLAPGGWVSWVVRCGVMALVFCAIYGVFFVNAWEKEALARILRRRA